MIDKKMNPNEVKEVISRLKEGQIIHILTEYKYYYGEEKREVIKGLFVERGSRAPGYEYITIIPAYNEYTNFQQIYWTIKVEVKNISEIKTARLGKEISEQLKSMHKELKEYQKLKAQIEELEKKVGDKYKNLGLMKEKVITDYIKTNENINEEILLKNLTNELYEKFKKRNETAKIEVYFNTYKEKEKNAIEVGFMGTTGKGFFSKDMYDSHYEYEHSDYDKLVQNYCYHVNEKKFEDKLWDVRVEKEANLGDKGSLEVDTRVILTLKKNKFNKSFAEQLKTNILEKVKSVI